MASSSTNQFFTSSTPADHPEEQSTTSSLQQKSFIQNLNEKEIEEFFETEETINWIKSNDFRKVALQFPDSFLPCSQIVCELIEKRTEAKTFILADTSYRSCCVDQIAAAHANCTALVHYGESCMSDPEKSIEVKYVLGKMPIDLDDFKTKVGAGLEKIEAEENVMLIMDSMYAHQEESLLNTLQTLLGPSKSVECASLIAINPSIPTESSTYLGRRVPSSIINQKTTNVIFCGSCDSSLIPLWLLSYPNCTGLTHYDPNEKTIVQENTKSSRLLRKRLFLVEKLKDANTVGLVVGSVGVDQHLEAVKRMRALCKSAGKKLYVISVGKINVPKLSNFSSDIDVFVLLSCPFGVLLDSSEFYRPVLSFFEAEIALNPAKSWAADSGWSAEFSTCLKDEIAELDGNDDKGDFSLVSGKVRTQHKKEDEDGTTSTVALYTAGDYFADRSWKGLDDGIRVEEETTVHEGKSGIAQGYEGR